MSKIRFKIYLLLPWLVLVLGVMISGIIWYFFDQSLLTQSKLSFDVKAQEISDSVNTRIKRDVLLLNSFQGFFASSDQVDREEFDTFITALDLENNYPGISSIYYFDLVSANDLSNFITDVQGDTSVNFGGYPDFKVWPETNASEHLILNYFYPHQENIKVMGFDFLSQNEYQIIVEKALSDNQAYTVREIGSVFDKGSGLNIILPVYKKGSISNRENAIGLLAVSIKLDQFFSAVFDEKQKKIWQDFDLEIFDVAPEEMASDTAHIFDYDGQKFVAAPDNLIKDFPVVLANLSWNLRIFSNHDYGLGRFDHSLSWVLSAGFLMVTLLLFVSLQLLVTSRRRALQQAESMTRDLKESSELFKAVTENAKDAIVMMDEKGLVVLWNKAAEKMFGYSVAEMLGKNLHQIIPAKAEHRNMKNILNFGKTGQSAVLDKSIELPVIKRDGTYFEVELTISGVEIKGHWHSVGIMRDITERKVNEEKLLRRTEDVERLNKTMVGRELKMIELKAEIEKLKSPKK